MELPVPLTVEPMLAKSVATLPVQPGMAYEPKWDGFRCLIFRDDDRVELISRGNKPFSRYFPDVAEQALAQLPRRCVVDTELVVIKREPGKLPRLDFDSLGQRIHPAASRVRLLATQAPADIIAFDLLALDDVSLLDTPYARRRRLLVEALGAVRPPVHVTPVTTDAQVARRWFTEFEGAGLDGLIAKPADLPYEPGKRLMYKIKHSRTADVVVAGFRWHKSGPIVGSLLLGLHDETGLLHHVGVSSSFTTQRRTELLDEIAAYRDPAEHPWLSFVDGQRVPGAQSRWTGSRDLSWEPLAPKLVLEVSYEAMEGDRFRHTAQFARWRPDREPLSCSYTQLDRPISLDVDQVLRTA